MTRKSPLPKQVVSMRLPEDLVAIIHQRAASKKTMINAEVEALLRAALAHEASAEMEQNALPLLRTTLRADQTTALDELRQALRADIRAELHDQLTHQSNRVAGLMIRTGRAAIIAWRLMQRIAYSEYGDEIANAWYIEAQTYAGKAMTQRIDQE